MRRVSLASFENQRDEYDAAVRSTDGIDRFCTSSDWVLAAHAAWAGRAPARVLRGDHGFAVFLDHVDPDGTRILISFDTMWGFCCPLAGPEPAPLAEEFARHLVTNDADWQVALLSGLDRDSRLFRALARNLAPHFLLRFGSPLRRWIASLEGGLDGFLERRSSKFRESLRRSRRRAQEKGIVMESSRIDNVAAAEKLFHRALAVEERSWKGPAETGLLIDDLQAFYREVAVRCARRGTLRAIFARHDDEDVGYILGATLDRAYRGFQFSFDRRYRKLSLGNLMQFEQIRELCDERIGIYDLGIDMPYKRHWAERTFDTVTLAVLSLS